MTTEVDSNVFNALSSAVGSASSAQDASKAVAGIYDFDKTRVHIIVMQMDDNDNFEYVFDPITHTPHTGGEDKSNGLYHVGGYIADEKSLKKVARFSSLEKIKADFSAMRNRLNAYVAQANGTLQIWLKAVSETIDNLYARLQKIDKFVDDAILDKDGD